MSHIGLSVHLKPSLFMDASVPFFSFFFSFARLTVDLKPSLFMDVSCFIFNE